MVSKKANSTVKVTAAKAEEKAAVKEAVGAKAVKAEEKAAKTPVAKPEEKADKKETEAAKAIETKKDSTMKLETKAAVLVDTPEVQTEETAAKETAKKAVKKVAETAEKAVKATAKAADKAVKKTVAKKTAAKKSTAKKAELKTEMFLQFAGKEYTEKEILQKVKEIWTKNLKRKVGEMKDVKIYLKPEESAAYYVVNGDTTGRVDL
ncbi:DUF6465 family protein [[Ruminococcus] lactaris]|uniref:DUF6465 family protein n=1 Tax=[Ruminococcus] lactaris TaxID=46228 RepID=UPI0039A1F2A5